MYSVSAQGVDERMINVHYYYYHYYYTHEQTEIYFIGIWLNWILKMEAALSLVFFENVRKALRVCLCMHAQEKGMKCLFFYLSSPSFPLMMKPIHLVSSESSCDPKNYMSICSVMSLNMHAIFESSFTFLVIIRQFVNNLHSAVRCSSK